MTSFAPSSGAMGGGAKFSLDKEGRSWIRDPRGDDISPPIGLRFTPIFSTGRLGTVTPSAAQRFCNNAGLSYCQPHSKTLPRDMHPRFPQQGSFLCHGRCDARTGEGQGQSLIVSTTFLPRNGNVPFPYAADHFDESENGSSLKNYRRRHFGRSDMDEINDEGVASSNWVGIDGGGELLLSNPAHLPRMNHVGYTSEFGKCGPSFTTNKYPKY